MALLIIAAVLLLATHHADFLLQAYQHHWTIYLPRELMAERAAHIGFFDFIPRDLWHVVQTVRNTTQWIAPVLIAAEMFFQKKWQRVLYVLLATGAAYAVTRALAFTLPKLIYTGTW